MCSITCWKGLAIQAHPRNFVLCWVEDTPVEQGHWKHGVSNSYSQSLMRVHWSKVLSWHCPILSQSQTMKENSPSLRNNFSIYCIQLGSVCVCVQILFSTLIKVREKSINFKPGLLMLKISITLCYTLHCSRSLRRKPITVNNILCLIGKL